MSFTFEIMCFRISDIGKNVFWNQILYWELEEDVWPQMCMVSWSSHGYVLNGTSDILKDVFMWYARLWRTLKKKNSSKSSLVQRCCGVLRPWHWPSPSEVCSFKFLDQSVFFVPTSIMILFGFLFVGKCNVSGSVPLVKMLHKKSLNNYNR